MAAKDEDDRFEDEEYTLSFLVLTIVIPLTSQEAPPFISLSLLLLPQCNPLIRLLVTLSAGLTSYSWYIRIGK